MSNANHQTAQKIINAHHHLGNMEMDEVVTYDELRSKLGYDIREDGYAFRKAIKLLWTDELKFIGNVHAVGYKRMTQEEAMQTLQSAPRRIRAVARDAVGKAQAIDPEQTTPETFQQTVSMAALLGAVAHLTHPRLQKRLAAAAAVETITDADYRQLMRDSIDAMKG